MDEKLLIEIQTFIHFNREGVLFSSEICQADLQKYSKLSITRIASNLPLYYSSSILPSLCIIQLYPAVITLRYKYYMNKGNFMLQFNLIVALVLRIN